MNKRVAFSALMAAVAAALSGCASKNIHRELEEDSGILRRKWTLSTRGPSSSGDRGAEFSNPVIVENTLVFGNRSVGLVAMYPTINQQRWVLPIQGGVVSPLTIDRGSIYFGGGDGFLYSVALETGRVQWRYDVRNPAISRPTVSGGRVFITTTDDTVYAFDAGTGKWLWHYRRKTAPSATIYGASTPLVDGNEVLAGLSDGFLVALSVPDGQLRWERRLHHGTKFTDVDAKPVMDGLVLYVPSYDGYLYALRRHGGETLWRFDAGGSKTVTVDGERLYLPSSDGAVYALQKNNAKQLWKFQLDSGTPTQAILTDKYVIVGSTHQYLYVLDKFTGTGLYRYNVGYGSGFRGAPAYDPETKMVYLLSGSGNLYAFAVTQPRRKILSRGMTDPYRFWDPKK